MKKKISICMDEELIERIDQESSQDVFRSRSHLIEFILKQALNMEKKSGDSKNDSK